MVWFVKVVILRMNYSGSGEKLYEIHDSREKEVINIFYLTVQGMDWGGLGGLRGPLGLLSAGELSLMLQICLPFSVAQDDLPHPLTFHLAFWREILLKTCLKMISRVSICSSSSTSFLNFVLIQSLQIKLKQQCVNLEYSKIWRQLLLLGRRSWLLGF